MVRGKHTSLEKRSRIVTLLEEGYLGRQIANKINMRSSTVNDIIKRYRTTGTLENRVRPGSSKKTTKDEDLRIVLLSKRNRKLTAPQIAAEVNRGREEQISVSTVKRRLQQANLHGRIAIRKPLLRRGNRGKRLQWARSHRNWSLDDWKQVLWSDESKFEVFGQNRRVYVRRSKTEKMIPDCILPTVKQGHSSVLVWGCFSFAGTGDLCRVQGAMKKENYLEILRNHAVPSGLRIIGNNFTFMQDNDPKHTAKVCKDYLREQQDQNTLKVMTWPPQSPDLNPIELLWDELDRRIRKVCPTSQEHLWNILQHEWNNIPQSVLTKLIARMPRVVRAVINNKGGFFDEKKI